MKQTPVYPRDPNQLATLIINLATRAPGERNSIDLTAAWISGLQATTVGGAGGVSRRMACTR
jgi:hypothetical protein